MTEGEEQSQATEATKKASESSWPKPDPWLRVSVELAEAREKAKK